MSSSRESGHLVLRQYYLDCLSHASYLVGDRSSGRAVVVDPRRDVDEYVADATAEGFRITHVIETHFHADFVSGHLELAKRTGADIVYGAAAAGRVEFPIKAMTDGDHLELGRVTLEVRETPGHTPESISVVVYPDAGAEPYAVLTGDTLFIGDVGRPDLLASAGASADALGRQLYRSLRERLLTLPDTTLVYPAHGAGSACGKHLGAETVSTIGEQRRTNYALAPMNEDQFVAAVTDGQSAAPMYFSFAATRNRQAHDLLDDDVEVVPLTIDQVVELQDAGAVVVDGRDAADFSAGHLRRSINVGLGGRFAEYVGEVVAPGTAIVIITDPGHELEAVVRLARIGFDSVAGALDRPIEAFTHHPHLVKKASRLNANQLDQIRRDTPNLQLIDVRNPGEVADGALPGAVHVALPALLDRLGELDPDVPTVVYCAGGYRSSIAASTLRAHDFADVSDLIGGYSACTASGPAPEISRRPTITPADAAARIAAGVFLLDVRQPEEWADRHIESAVLIPLPELPDRFGELPADQPIIVVCRSGNRSGRATDALRAAGIDALNLDGGINAWTAAGLPTRAG
jgi:rhodanese-related sulfurtransferase/glyoxylase-like metal-dependent hydrolase (beta-lactamase superfamily II)